MEKPILFNTEMVKAILEGRKTVTRRVVKFPEGMTGRLPESGARDYIYYPGGIKRPPYQVGDILYVRETFCNASDGTYRYKASASEDTEKIRKGFGVKWKPSIHMPREAVRIFLKVTDVRVERLQDINCPEAKKEGVLADESIREDGRFLTERGNFIELWDSTIKKSELDKYSWESNPWVWVIEFERISKEDHMKK